MVLISRLLHLREKMGGESEKSPHSPSEKPGAALGSPVAEDCLEVWKTLTLA